ncbi:MAG: ABC transporter ATP-binding protein [Anaerolineaceae bacterium]|nr:ABC transporter ATP-binding protein [Anaerolineaceae bacterium]
MPTVSDSPIIELRNVTVQYRLPKENYTNLKEFVIHLVQRKVQFERFSALNDITFQVKPNQIFGIVGKNGAGKSTMLKVIARVLLPTQGRVIVRGKVFPLLELGGGFHPDLTGRENIFVNGELLGIPLETIKNKFDEIVDFAELHEFIDAPLRTYSTGMISRLAFSVATCQKPDILLADEVLSVGDVAFQKKCIDRIDQYTKQGSTILLVTHSVRTVRNFCTDAVWIDHGKVKMIGTSGEIADAYQQTMIGSGTELPIAQQGEMEFN